MTHVEKPVHTRDDDESKPPTKTGNDKPAGDKSKNAPKPSGPGTTSKKAGPGLGSATSTVVPDTDPDDPKMTKDGTVDDPLLDREVNLADWDPRIPPHGTPIARPDPGRPYPEDGERGVAWTLPPSVEGSVEAFPVGATMADPTGAKSTSGKSDADVASKSVGSGSGHKPTNQTTR